MRRNSKSEFLKRIGLAFGLAVTVMMLAQPKSFAQSTGTVTGTVYDQSGAVVPKASVELINDATKDKRRTTTNAEGYFSFGSIPPGAYTTKVSSAGFKGWEQSGIPVRPGDVRNVAGISLEVGSQGETVSVEAVAGQVAPVDSGERSSVLTAKQIENTSLEGRDATELIRTLPGFAVFNGGSINNQAQDFTVVSPTGGAVGQGSSGNGAPYRGGTDLVSDGAHIIDNGCNCGATTTVNGDMVSEVKVQTSNFGADSAKGPIVINAIGKSGSTSYHGEAYLHARDNSINSLDWAFKHQLILSKSSPLPLKPPSGRFEFPGAQFGGPVPGTNKKLLFHTAFEYYYQHDIPLSGPSIAGLLTDTVPTLSMRQGIFDLNPAVAADNAAFCSSGGNGGQPVCQNTFNTAPTSTSPTGTTSFGWANQAGTAFPNSQATISPTTDFDPGAAVLLANIPLPNADPTATGGFNYLSPQNINQNGWMWRTRGDYNISDTNKVYATYQIQKETDNVPVHLWWQPSNSIPFPGGMASHDNSRTITGHFLHVFGPTLTNDFSTALGYINYPLVRNSKTSWALSTGGVAGTPYPYKGPYPSKSLMMPDIGDGYWLAGIPQMIQPDIFSNGGNFVWEKWNYSFEDNVTKSYKTHTFKAGFYYERTTNNQGAFTDYNGHIEAAVGFSGAVPFNNCNPVSSGGTTTYSTCGSNNPLASLLLGVGSYDQVNKSALDNLWYPTYSAFLQDDWKVTKRLTLNLGLRGDHLGAWRPSNSFGVATWTGDLNTPVAGFDWKGRNSRIPLSGRDISAITWEPRFGLAYNLFGDGKTVLRGGWGEYGYRDQWNDYATPADLSQGVIQYNSGNPVTQSFVNGLNGTLPTTGTCGAIPPGGGPSPAQCGNTFGVLLRDHQQPISRNYNFTISQQLPLNSLLEVGYVGSESLYGDLSGNTGALDIKNLNVVPLGAMFTAAGCTPLQATAGCSFSATQNSLFPYFNSFGTSDVGVVRHLAKTNYHGLQMSWVRQTGRITYNLNYTWSKALGTQGTGQLNGLAPDATNLGHDYGVLSIDRSHVINLSYVFQTGNPVKGNAFLGYLVNGWNLSGITTWQSGPDITTLSSTNLGLGGTGPAFDTGTTDASGNEVFNTYGISNLNYIGTPNANLQPTVTCNPTKNLAAHQYYNANCFSLPGGGQNGPWQLPYIHGPAYFNSDLALFKQFRITERQGIEFRVSAFNFLNHPLDSFQNNGDNKLTYNYTCATGPCTNGTGTYTLTNAPVGKYVLNGSNIATGYASTRFGRRVMEFSAKYTF